MAGPLRIDGDILFAAAVAVNERGPDLDLEEVVITALAPLIEMGAKSDKEKRDSFPRRREESPVRRGARQRELRDRPRLSFENSRGPGEKPPSPLDRAIRAALEWHEKENAARRNRRGG